MAGPVAVEWSQAALDDLKRFSRFLVDQHPQLAPIVAHEIIVKSQLLSQFPRLGRPLKERPEYRQLVLNVLNAPYVFQYRFADERIVMLRVFHGRELRE